MNEESDRADADWVANCLRAEHERAPESPFVLDEDGNVMGPLRDLSLAAVKVMKNQPWYESETRNVAWRAAIAWAKDLRPDQRAAIREQAPAFAEFLDDLARRWDYR